MGQVIELRRARAVREPAPNTPYGCARCGADLWNLFADGRVRCADCEQECPLRTVGSNGPGHELNPNEQSNNRE
jgi:hypothetical protein